MHFLFQCGNMAREGLRTLVVGKKELSEEAYCSFEVPSTSTSCSEIINGFIVPPKEAHHFVQVFIWLHDNVQGS